METASINHEHAQFVHLHVHTEYSLLDGAGRIKDIIKKAKDLQMPAIAITDHGSMYGVIDFYKEAKSQGIKPIIGCEVYIAPGSRFDKKPCDGENYYHLILLAENQIGYKNLLKLVSCGHLEGFYYKPRIDKELLQQHHEGLIALSACLAGEIPSYILKGDHVKAEDTAKWYLDLFGPERFYLELQDQGLPEEVEVNRELIAIARKLNIGLVATNDIHYVNREDAESHEVLLCIQTGKTIEDSNRMKFPNDQFYLKSAQEMAEKFASIPEALENTSKIAAKCCVEFDFSQHYLPEFPLPEGMTDTAYLHELCAQGLKTCYPVVTDKIQERLNYELNIIEQMGFSSYFLIVWDFINYAKQEKIPVGPGRGSAAGSIVAYLLGITNIDPLRYGLLFERFLNPERVTMPDIDTDLCYVGRSKIIDYVASRYGKDHVAQIVTFGTMAAKAAIRDVGRALNMQYGEVDRIAKLVPSELGITLKRALEVSPELKEGYVSDPKIKKLLELAMALEGLPRHASTHAAGLVISKDPLTEYVPIQFSNEDFQTTQYDKDRIEEIGLLKMDLLGLRTLTVIGDALSLIKQNRGIEIDIEKIALDDEKTSKMLSAGDTVGVFQMESGGMTNLVKDLQPEKFEDLIPLVALYRPGPLGSGMVEDFIAGRHGKKKVTYLHPLLEPILKDTFGVILYQEQVMQIASALAGFTLGQADLLRRAMGKKKHSVLEAQKESFLAGAKERNIAQKLAEDIFNLMAHFADYGFNKSHSAAYALVAYQTAYLKAHYPEEFMAALLTSVMGTNEKVGYYIEQCRKMGMAVLPPDINVSTGTFTVDSKGIRFGLAAIKNVGENAIESVLKARIDGGKFESLVDFCCRVDLRVVNKRVVESFIKCGAFDSFGECRSQLLEVLDQAFDIAVGCQKDADSGQIGLFGEPEEYLDTLTMPNIPEFPQEQLLAMEKELTGFYVSGHPLDAYKDKLKFFSPLKDLFTSETKDAQKVRAAGVISSAKRIVTKNGENMCFFELEDYTSSVEVIVFPRIFYQANDLLIPDMAVVVTGRVTSNEETVKIIADKVERLSNTKPEVKIVVSREKQVPAVLDKLKETLASYHGDSVVYLCMARGQIIKTDECFWLEPSSKAIAALEGLLGKNSVTVV